MVPERNGCKVLRMQAGEKWIIRDKQRFLRVLMDRLAGTASMSFEGDLSGCKLHALPNASEAESNLLRRNTIWPKQDFITVPLEKESTKPIVSALGGTIPKPILHIQIEKDGQLQVGMYDQRFAAFSATPLSQALKAQLIEERVIVRADHR